MFLGDEIAELLTRIAEYERQNSK